MAYSFKGVISQEQIHPRTFKKRVVGTWWIRLANPAQEFIPHSTRKFRFPPENRIGCCLRFKSLKACLALQLPIPVIEKGFEQELTEGTEKRILLTLGQRSRVG